MFRSSKYLVPALFLSALSTHAQSIEEIVINADFRQAELMDIPSSISVIDSQSVSARGAQHFEHILNLSPNVNLSAGASRGRFIQIRGIGERSQFVDPVNPSVGLLVDGIDYSGVGTAGTLFDVQQVEVLRGPQGTRFGNNALAGLININTQAPSEEFEGVIQAGVGNYNAREIGGVINGALSDTLLARLAVQQFKGDGYIENEFLNRENTNNFDELTARGKLRWLASDDLTADVTLFYADIDNGYDAFSLDNDRNTQSDAPGRDGQETYASAVKLAYTGNERVTIESQVAFSKSDLDYGFDEDWTFVGFDPEDYSQSDNFLRDRDNITIDIRALSNEAGALFGQRTSWVAGIYHEAESEDLSRRPIEDSAPEPVFASSFDKRISAVYFDTDTQLTENLSLIAGVRYERFDADYDDNQGTRLSPGDDLWGAQLGLEYLLSDNYLAYFVISRAEKSGSVNGEALAQDDGSNSFFSTTLRNNREFDSEGLTSYELGFKGSLLDDALNIRVTAFYMQRQDLQLNVFLNQGVDFVGFLDNVDEGSNYGAEVELDWAINRKLSVFAGLGWLETEIDDTFLVRTPDFVLVDQESRDQAHAPSYQFNVGAHIAISDTIYARFEVEGKDEFFFSNSHDAQSDAFELANLTLGYKKDNVEVTLWGRNIFDTRYEVRGFRFGNDPRNDFAPNTFVQLGEPAVFGITGRYSFK